MAKSESSSASCGKLMRISGFRIKVATKNSGHRPPRPISELAQRRGAAATAKLSALAATPNGATRLLGFTRTVNPLDLDFRSG